MKLLLTTAILSIAIVIAAGQRLHAQARDRSTLSGTVVDETGAVLRGVAIVLTNSETTARRRLTTDSRNVIGGPSAFVMVAENHNSFGQAIVKKMIAEIAFNPPPRGVILR